MTLRISAWPPDVVEKYRALATDLIQRDGLLTEQSVESLRDIASATDLAGFAANDVDLFFAQLVADSSRHDDTGRPDTPAAELRRNWSALPARVRDALGCAAQLAAGPIPGTWLEFTTATGLGGSEDWAATRAIIENTGLLESAEFPECFQLSADLQDTVAQLAHATIDYRERTVQLLIHAASHFPHDEAHRPATIARSLVANIDHFLAEPRVLNAIGQRLDEFSDYLPDTDVLHAAEAIHSSASTAAQNEPDDVTAQRHLSEATRYLSDLIADPDLRLARWLTALAVDIYPGEFSAASIRCAIPEQERSDLDSQNRLATSLMRIATRFDTVDAAGADELRREALVICRKVVESAAEEPDDAQAEHALTPALRLMASLDSRSSHHDG